MVSDIDSDKDKTYTSKFFYFFICKQNYKWEYEVEKGLSIHVNFWTKPIENCSSHDQNLYMSGDTTQFHQNFQYIIDTKLE